MRFFLGLILVLITTQAGCYFKCGTYTAKTGMSSDGLSLDRDDYFEACGTTVGVWGDIDLMGDGNAWLTFAPSHRNNDVDWAAIALQMDLQFPNTELVDGAHITDTTGGAAVVDMSGNIYSVAGLTSATVDVRGVREADEECAPFRAQSFQLEWTAEYGTEEGEYHYTATGKDWVSLFLDQSSSDTGCLWGDG